MKDNRPSRKESKAQDNIREYLQDIAMGNTTHFSSSTVGKWRSRYKDFRKSEKQAWRDYENLFENAPIVNEVEAPKVEAHDIYVIEDFRTRETCVVNENAKKFYNRLDKERIDNACRAIEWQFKHRDLFDWLLIACLGCILLPLIAILFMSFR